MKIKLILEYNFNYAEYIVTDGKHDLICMCLSVPLSDNKEPKTGMQIKNLYAFSYENTIRLNISNNKKCYIKKDKNDYFKYKVCGSVEDSKKATIKVFEFVISLEYYYPEGFNSSLKNGEYVEFYIDRVDCTLLDNTSG